MRNYIVFFLLIFFSNFGFYLIPWSHMPGVFTMTDVGLLVILVSLLGIALYDSSRFTVIFSNFGSYLIVLYILMILVTVSVASFNYNQSIFDGLIGIRDQLYYLSFFIFLSFFRTLNDAKSLLVLATYIAGFLVVISVFSYLTSYTIFYHKWAEGHGIRSGVVRAWIPAMPVIAMALFWNFSLIEESRAKKIRAVGLFLFFCAAFVFRQTRGHLIGIAAGIFGTWLMQGRYLRLVVMSVFVLPIVVIIDLMTLGILSGLFVSTVNAISEESGTWAPRVSQIQFALSQIREHLIFGTGGDALRGIESSGAGTLGSVSYKADLGYLSFLKAYGLVGGLWLTAFFMYVFKGLRTARKTSLENALYLNFCAAYMLYVLVSFITINHFMYPSGIVSLMFVFALLVRLTQEKDRVKAPLKRQKYVS
jgi:O-antigen ligase